MSATGNLEVVEEMGSSSSYALGVIADSDPSTSLCLTHSNMEDLNTFANYSMHRT